MSANELVLLDQALAEAQASRDEPLPGDVAFELFAAEQVLKDYDLSLEEIEAGRVGGGQDGAIDGVYVFLSDTLVTEDAEVLSDEATAASFARGLELTLWIIQAKTTPSFTETAIDLLASSLRRLLDLQETDDGLGMLYSVDLISKIRMFTKAWQKLALRRPTLNIRVAYVTRGDTDSVNERVHKKATDLAAEVRKQVPTSDASFVFVGASQLWQLYNKTPSYSLELEFQENATSGSSHVAIVRLRDYWQFISDENGSLRRHIFDWNVRDYQGDVEVNKEIRESASDAEAPEFWWMNNGVTVVCSSARIVSKRFILDDVQVVNGLQTSHTIYDVLRNRDVRDGTVGNKLLLVRILATNDPATRDAVIRATNRQTAVSAASLRATDEIQRQIESYFVANDWYYDRRKNYYRNIGKRPDRIVSIPLLAQVVMAAGLSAPNDSRARPSSLLKRGEDYERVFSPEVPLATYLWLAKLQRNVDSFLSALSVGTPSERSNLRFHVTMLVVARRFGSRVYNPRQLTALSETDTSPPSADEIQAAFEAVAKYARGLTQDNNWTLDRVAKSQQLVSAILRNEFPSTGGG